MSPLVEKTLTEEGITLLIEVRYAIRILVREVFMLSVYPLLSLFLRGTVAYALYFLRSTIKFVSPVIMSLRVFSFNK